MAAIRAALDTPIQESLEAQALTSNSAGPQIVVDVLAPLPLTQLPPVYVAIGQSAGYIPLGLPYTPLYYPVSIPEPPAWALTILALVAIACLLFVGRFLSWFPLISRGGRS